MRKALIAVAVATALFAVGAFAAALSVQSEDIASGTDPLGPCATNVLVDFGDPEIAGGVWSVDDATVRFTNGTGTLVNTCDNFEARLAIDSGLGLVAVSATESDVSGGLADFSFTALPVNPIVAASVVVDGATLTADIADLP